MKFSHPTDNDFFRFLINAYPECWIFSLESLQCFLESSAFFFIDWRNSKRNDRLWYKYTATLDIGFTHLDISKSISCCTIKSKQCKYISSLDFINIFHLIAMHLHHSADFHPFFRLLVKHHISFFYFALIYSYECQLPELVFI